ncbi:MAG: BamA/TamA family outer membrane protein [Gemmatimonadota bacterium]
MHYHRCHFLAALSFSTLLLSIPQPLLAQRVKPAPAPGSDSATVAAGARYDANGFHRFFFGGKYRHLWRTPLRVPVLNLATYGGGLRGDKEGGGVQTKSLRLVAANGVEYVFRSVDKDNVELAPKFKGTIVERIAKDEVSSSNPGSALVAASLMEAVDILHVTPKLFVMPDDERLGEFREEYAGRLGLLEEFPSIPKDHAGFAGAAEIIDSEELLKLLNQGGDNRVDTRQLAAARLMDMFLNDWDRHPGQWKWARFEAAPGLWHPIPRDRDKAFIWYAGLIPRLARIAAPNLAAFSTTYPSIRGLTINSLDFDRRLLSGLEQPEWDSIATSLATRLTDSVIDQAMLALPREYQSVRPSLARTLKARRDILPLEADRFYRYLSDIVDLNGTDGPDRLRVDRIADDTVHVRLQGAEGAPYFDRHFVRSDTREIRVYLHGGNDQALVRGDVNASIPVRVIGGNGTNRLVDSSRVGGKIHPTRLYDQGETTGIRYGPDTMFSRRPWIEERGKLVSPTRDRESHLSPILGFAFDDDFGFVPRIGVNYYQYGFGHRPYARRIAMTGEYASRFGGWRVEMLVDQRKESSPLHFVVTARMSQLEIIRFHGFGNQTAGGDVGHFFDVGTHQWTLQPAVAWSLGPRSDLYFGPVAQYTTTDSTPNRFISNARPYGSGEFAEAGIKLALRYDVRDEPTHPRSGLLADLSTTYFPEMGDVGSAFGVVQGSTAAYLTFPLPLHPILAVRVGAKRVFGSFPYFEAAFLGGGTSVRNIAFERFAGDAAVNGTVELRVPLANFSFILPLDAGVFALADAGRVYQDRASPGGWHSAFGGGFWIGLLDPSTALSFAFTNGEERTGAFVKLGLNF